MKKIILSAFLAASFLASAQENVFSEDFQDFEFASGLSFEDHGWTLINVDQNTVSSGYQDYFPGNIAWSAIAYEDEPENIFAASTSWFSPAGTADRWLISPEIDLTAHTGAALTFKSRGTDEEYPDGFELYVSTTGTAIADFTDKIYSIDAEVPDSFVENTLDLSAYDGQVIHLAWRQNTHDGYIIIIDDISVDANLLGTTDFFAKHFSVYPNPSNSIVNLNSKTNSAINSVWVTDLNGRIVKTANANGVSQTQVNIADLSNGMYLLNVQTEAGTATAKIVKN